jgi:hypothetical protein
MKQRRVLNRSSSDADYYLTTIEKIPGGIAPQRLWGFSAILHKFAQNQQNHWAPTVSPLTA